MTALARTVTSDAVEPRREIFLPPYDALSDEALLAHCLDRATERFRPVEDHTQTTPEKLAGVMANRFDLINETFDLPDPIDWLRNPSRDLEWQILLHKFYFSVGLCRLYAETGEARYLRKWMALTASWIEQIEADLVAGTSPLNSELFVAVTGRRLQNWIYAYHHVAAARAAEPALAAFNRRFIASIRDQVNQLVTVLAPSRNHRTIELSAIFLAAVAFPELRDAKGWLDIATRELCENIRADLLPDGVQCELSTDYHHLVLRNYLSVSQLARMNGVALPSDIDERLRRALGFALHVHKPDGLIPSLSDGDIHDYRGLLRLGHELYGDPAMLYVATEGAEGARPRERSVWFPDAGYAVLRSGWGAREPYRDERYLVLDCGPLGEGNHGHLDCLSFEAAAYGRSLVVDPGRYTYSEAGDVNWRVLFRGGAYHNSVLIDGRNQTRYAPRPKKPGRPDKHKIQGPAPDAELRAFVSCDGSDYLHGVARSHEYDAVHERRIFFVGGAYWIIWDQLSAETEHSYAQLFHLSDEAEGRVSSGTENGTIRIVAPGLVIARAEEEGVSLRVEPGFVSRVYGEKHPAPVVAFDHVGRNATLHAVLAPWRDDVAKVGVRRLVVSSPEGGSAGHAVEVVIENADGARRRDVAFIAPEDGRRRCFAGWRFDGAWLLLRLDESGALRETHAPDGAAPERLADWTGAPQ